MGEGLTLAMRAHRAGWPMLSPIGTAAGACVGSKGLLGVPGLGQRRQQQRSARRHRLGIFLSGAHMGPSAWYPSQTGCAPASPRLLQKICRFSRRRRAGTCSSIQVLTYQMLQSLVET